MQTGSDVVSRRRVAALIVWVATCLIAAWPAAALAIPGSGPHETVDITLSSAASGASAGLTYVATYHAAGDPQGLPPALRRIVIVGPPGAGGDTSVPGRCDASDTQLKLMGEAACPPDSRVGSGVVTVRATTSSQPETYDTTLFNADHQQIELVKFGAGGIGVARSSINGTTIDGTVPTCITGGQPPSGCPSDEVEILSQRLTTTPLSVGAGTSRRDYLTTPPTCPATGRWQTHVTFYYADGSVETVVTEELCAPANSVAPGPTPGGPGAAACVSRRRIRLAHLAAQNLRSVSVRIRGRTVLLDGRRPVIDLRGLPRGRFTVTIVATTDTGRRLHEVRRFRTCAGRGR
jgi:hypothetical protein